MKHLLILGFIALIGCSSSDNDTAVLDEPLPAPDDDVKPVGPTDDIARLIVDRQWVLTAVVDGAGTQIPVFQEPGFEFTVSFGSNLIELGDLQGQLVTPISGINVCNFYGGGYLLEGDVLNLLAVGEDAADCERSSEMTSQLFGDILFSFNNPPMLSVDVQLLTMTSGTNELLIFTDNDSVELTALRTGDLASQCNSTFSQPRFQYFRDQQSLDNLYESFVQLPCTLDGPPQIDFDNSTALFVAHEIVGSGGHSIEIVSARKTSDRLTVEIQKTAPGENCIVTDAPTGPYQIYSVVGVHENVDFVERPTLNPSCN